MVSLYLAREGDACRNGSVRRNALEMVQLICTDSEHFEYRGIDRAQAALHEWRNQGVERCLAPKHTGREFVREPSVGIGQPGESALECAVEGEAAAHIREDAERGTPRCEAGVVQRSIPSVVVDGTAISRRGIRPAR